MVTWWYLVASSYPRPAWFHDFDPILHTFSTQTTVDFAVDIVAQGQTHLGIAEDGQMTSNDFCISSPNVLYLPLRHDPSQIDILPCWTCHFDFSWIHESNILRHHETDKHAQQVPKMVATTPRILISHLGLQPHPPTVPLGPRNLGALHCKFSGGRQENRLRLICQ